MHLCPTSYCAKSQRLLSYRQNFQTFSPLPSLTNFTEQPHRDTLRGGGTQPPISFAQTQKASGAGGAQYRVTGSHEGTGLVRWYLFPRQMVQSGSVQTSEKSTQCLNINQIQCPVLTNWTQSKPKGNRTG